MPVAIICPKCLVPVSRWHKHHGKPDFFRDPITGQWERLRCGAKTKRNRCKECDE
jgi:hypothetical protein